MLIHAANELSAPISLGLMSVVTSGELQLLAVIGILNVDYLASGPEAPDGPDSSYI